MQDNFYVYIWYNPENNQPFYVGKGTGKRAYDVSDKSRNVFFMRKYNKIKSTGLEPYVVIEHDNLTESDALSKEHELILKYKPTFEGGILTNLSYSTGGKSTIAESTRDKLSHQSSGEHNGMAKFTKEQITECFELLIKGYSNKEVEKETNVPSHIVSDLRYGKKWKTVYEDYKYQLENLKVSGLNKYNLSFDDKINIIHDIATRDKDTQLKDIAKKYNVKETMIVSVNLKRQWKNIWKYYLDKKS